WTIWSKWRRANKGRNRKIPATRVLKRRPEARSSPRQSATAGASGATGKSERSSGGRPERGAAKRGELGRHDTARESRRHSHAGCCSGSRIAGRSPSEDVARRNRRGALHSGGGACRWVRGRSAGSVNRPRSGPHDVGRFPVISRPLMVLIGTDVSREIRWGRGCEA